MTRKIREVNELIPCACGCGELIDKIKWRKIRKYKRGHNVRHAFIEFVYCACGCGKTRSKYEHGQERKFIQHHQIKGEENINWKHGRYTNNYGHVKIIKWDHPYHRKDGLVYEHRLVMEQYLGRYLKPEEVVHHENEIPDDNRIENLKLFKNHREHMLYHNAKKRQVTTS